MAKGYYENSRRTINVWDDGDCLHIFINVYAKWQYEKAVQKIAYIKRILGLNFTHEYDGTQIYFTLADYDELNEFRNMYYKNY